MTITPKLLFLVAGIACFVLAGLNLGSRRFNPFPIGWAFVVTAVSIL